MPTEMPVLDQHDGAKSQSMRFHFVVDAFFRHWMLMLMCTAIGAIGGLLYSVASKQTNYIYSARASLTVKPSYWHSPAMANLEEYVFPPTTASSLMQSVIMEDLRRDIAVALIQDDIQKGKALGNITRDDEIDSKSLRLLGQVEFEHFDERNIIQVTAHNSEGDEEAKRIADFSTTVLIKHTQLRRKDIQEEIHTLVRAELESLRTNLDTSQNILWNTREEMGFHTNTQVWTELEEKSNQILAAKVHIDVLTEAILEKMKP